MVGAVLWYSLGVMWLIIGIMEDDWFGEAEGSFFLFMAFIGLILQYRWARREWKRTNT